MLPSPCNFNYLYYLHFLTKAKISDYFSFYRNLMELKNLIFRKYNNVVIGFLKKEPID